MKKLFITLSFIVLSSCSVKKLALNEISNIIDTGITQKIFTEDNLIYIKDSLPANLKLLEIINLQSKNIKNTKNLALGLCGYGYAFFEEEREISSDFIKKGMGYSSSFISEKKFTLKKNIKDEELDLFFSDLFCKLVYLDINRDDIGALDLVSEIEENTQKFIEIKPDYMNGFLKAVRAYIYASKPSVAGGSIEKARELFELSLSGNGADFLLNKYLFMRFAAITGDEKLFDTLYDEINLWDNKNDRYAFFNKVAQIKARKLKERKNEYF